MKRKGIALVLAAVMLLGLCACSEQGQAVNVQRADRLAQDGLNVQRYPAMVVSEDAVTVQRDGSKTILECYVTVGQQVRMGEVLFTYDLEQLELDLEKQKLELEKLQNEQQTYAGQLEDLEKELKNTWSESEKVRLTLEINMLKTTQLENNYTILSRQKSIADLEQMLQNVDYQVVDAEENQELVGRFGIMQAPTLIVLNDGKVEKYVNASNIKKYVETHKTLTNV